MKTDTCPIERVEFEFILIMSRIRCDVEYNETARTVYWRYTTMRDYFLRIFRISLFSFSSCAEINRCFFFICRIRCCSRLCLSSRAHVVQFFAAFSVKFGRFFSVFHSAALRNRQRSTTTSTEEGNNSVPHCSLTREDNKEQNLSHFSFFSTPQDIVEDEKSLLFSHHKIKIIA